MKKLVLSTLLAGLFLIPAASVSAQQNETAHWSLGVKLGADYYRVTPNIGDYLTDAGWDAGLFLEYSINPLWGFGLSADYLTYNRDKSKYVGKTLDLTLYSAVDMTNLLSPERRGFWQKVSINANLGAGAALYAYELKDRSPIVETGIGDNFSPMILTGLNVEVALGKSVGLFAEGQYRYYLREDLGGMYSSNSNGDDAFVANLGLRFKFGAGKKDHVRNTLPTAKDSEALAEIKRELQQLKNQADKTTGDVDKLSTSLGDAKKKQDEVNKDLKNDIDNLRKSLNELGEQQSSNAVMHNIEFKFDSADLTSASFTALDNIAAVLKSNSTWNKLTIAGHSDSIGTKEINQRISKERAEAVKKYLVESGIPAGKIETIGHGAEKPITSNNTSTGRQQNRRVEFQLSK